MRITKARIDRGKVHVALEGLSPEQAISLLFDAVALVPDAELPKLFARHLDVKQLSLDDPAKQRLLSQVRAFDAASRAGRYYEGFNVNSKNYMEKSTGTRTFIAECNRLLDRCVARAANDDPTGTSEAFELIFTLFKDIDGGRDDIVFFADEAGSWQIGADWIRVLPAWFACLAGTVEPDEYARRVVEIVDEFDGYSRTKHFAVAKRIANASQRKALAAEIAKRPRRRR